MKNHKLTTDRLKRFHQLENIALVLDEFIESGDVDKDKIEKTQIVLDQFANLLIDKNKPDPKTYVLYEIQALLHWINEDEKQAYDFIRTARLVKGSDDLFTSAGRKLLFIISADSKKKK